MKRNKYTLYKNTEYLEYLQYCLLALLETSSSFQNVSNDLKSYIVTWLDIIDSLNNVSS